MKNTKKNEASKRPLKLARETLRALTHGDLMEVAGGAATAPSRGPCPTESKALTCWCAA